MTLASNKPNVGILWRDMANPGNGSAAGREELRVKGELVVFVLYTGDEEDNPLQWWSRPCPSPTRWNAAAVPLI